MQGKTHFITIATATLSLAAALPADALPLPQDEAERACWLRHTAERTRVNLKEPTQVAFSNLRDGDRVRSPLLVEFAVRGMGVAPAGQPQPGTGHHHLLVNAPLPTDPREKIPFSDTHRHFGKGQTAAVVDLPPGRHTLRLLFADHEHRPHFVYSPEITVTVTGPRTAAPLKIDPRRFDETCRAWYQDEKARPKPPGDLVAITNLRDGETVTSPFNVRFGVDGWGVCAAGQTAERTGHFMLDILQGGAVLRSADFSNGATQSNLSLPDGAYRLRLRFVDGRRRAEVLPAAEITVNVSGQQRL